MNTRYIALKGLNVRYAPAMSSARKVIQPLRDSQGVSSEVLSALEDAFVTGVYGDRAKPGDSQREQASRQPLLLGLSEVTLLRTQAEAICRAHPQDAKAASNDAKKFFDDNRKNFRAMREQLSVEISQ